MYSASAMCRREIAYVMNRFPGYKRAGRRRSGKKISDLGRNIFFGVLWFGQTLKSSMWGFKRAIL